MQEEILDSESLHGPKYSYASIPFCKIISQADIYNAKVPVELTHEDSSIQSIFKVQRSDSERVIFRSIMIENTMFYELSFAQIRLRLPVYCLNARGLTCRTCYECVLAVQGDVVYLYLLLVHVVCLCAMRFSSIWRLSRSNTDLSDCLLTCGITEATGAVYILC